MLKMNWIKAFTGAALMFAFCWVGSHKIGMLPPLGSFFNPYQGFWQNAELSASFSATELQVEGLKSATKVVFDERGVAHVFATNDDDLYFVQGYLTAKDRLWQMEFQTHAAAGRLSEMIGKKALSFDLEQRRIGMTWSAEKALELILTDTASRLALQAYAAGINAYIAQLTEATLPLEYKLLDYKPEPWTPLKSALLLKYMAKMLNGNERDRPNTAALQLLGAELFSQLFPNQQYLTDPIVPNFLVDTAAQTTYAGASFTASATWPMKHIQPNFVGSNNWAVSGNRTQNGHAILCNDPHLGLSLPSIWHEIQLHSPTVNCYGVALPGAPGITIGFNDSIAWGVTNAGRDVKDYLEIDFVDEAAGTYQLGQEIKTADKRLEHILVRGGKTVIDTVLYTVFGPVAYTDSITRKKLALRWLAHDASNEWRTFYELNRAQNVKDFTAALAHYNSPGQNFAYADTKNNIAIWQQGRFKIVPQNYGRFILDGSLAQHQQEQFIPQEQNPHQINPERGFVSSANQPPTDATYPYYYSGVFEEFRNRTINNFLRSDSAVSIQDMMDLQLSNFNMLAAEALPIMLELLDTNLFQYPENERRALKELLDWNYENNSELIAPTVFEIWWDELNNLLWDEFNKPDWDQSKYYMYSWEQLMKNGKAKIDMRDPKYVYPMAKVTLDLLKNQPNHIVFDHRATNNSIEVAQNVVYDSFYWTAMKFGDIIKYKYNRPEWGYYKATRVKHLARLDAFSSKKLPIGGSEHAPNAMTATHGPSWRMIVEMDPTGPRAWGVLPGGQSGNPGSKHYTTSLLSWARGDYHSLHFLNNAQLSSPEWNMQTFKPAKQ